MNTKFTTITLVILIAIGNAVIAKQQNYKINKLQFLKANRIVPEQNVHNNFSELLKLTETEISLPGYSEDYSWDMQFRLWHHVTNTTYKYNESGKLIEEIVQDAVNDIYLLRTSYSYDNFGNLTEEVSHIMRTGEWTLVSGKKSLYSISGDGQISSVTEQTFENEEWTYKNKIEYVLNSSGIPVGMQTFKWNGNDWTLFSKTVNISWADWQNKKLAGYTIQYPYNQTWINVERYSAEYHGDNYTETIELWDNQQWVNSQRESYSKSATEEVLVLLDWTDAGWELVGNYRTTFDFMGNQTGFHYSTWDVDKWIVEMEMYFDLTYNESNDVTEMVVRQRDKETEVSRNISKHNYSSFLHLTTDVPEIPILNNVKVFPNPISKDFTIKIDETKPTNYQVNIINLVGQTIFSNTYFDSSISVNTDGFTAGMYLLNIKTNDGRVFNTKLLKN